MNKKVFLSVLILIILSSFSFAFQGSDKINLLAVSESEGDIISGSVATLFLDIKPGNGRLFIDTYPFTKLDTQFTTRYAKSFACDYTNTDCSNYDFFYTIKAGSTIIGGPSAGAATALITAAMLDNKVVPSDISVTGTIGSGGVIGPVGGVEKKIIAAAKEGITKVYIPKINDLNLTQIANISENYEIEIIPVFNFDELYASVFNLELDNGYFQIYPTNLYIETMKGISMSLCEDSRVLLSELETKNLSNSSYLIDGMKLLNESVNASVNGNYYSAASFCFGASSKFQLQSLILLNDSEVHILKNNLSFDYMNFSESIKSSSIKSFTDLQAFMITTQRLVETSDYLFDLNMTKKTNFSLSEKESLAFAIVRFNSAVYWSRFLGIEENSDFIFDDSALLNSCLSKINEVEGYINYVKDYLSLPLLSTAKGIENAYQDYYRGNYALCLFKATKARADTELILSSMGVSRDDLPTLLAQKEDVSKNAIKKSIDKGIFPILAYSYYDYAMSLDESDPYSALLYFEYASAMSDIGVYFEKEKSNGTNPLLRIPKEYYTFLSLGFILGFAVSSIIFLFLGFFLTRKSRNKLPAHKKNRKKK